MVDMRAGRMVMDEKVPSGRAWLSLRHSHHRVCHELLRHDVNMNMHES